MVSLAMDRFLCWKLKVATFVVAIFVIITASVACLLELLDIADHASESFHIRGGFKAEWRSHVWEGWLACNIVMLVCHLIIIAYSVIMIFAIKIFPTFYEYSLTRVYLALLIIYSIVELGTSLYKYSWYGPNTFRLAFLVFSFLFWLARAILNIVSMMIVYSRIKELDYEIQYGEKKLLNPYMIPDYDARSGRATPSLRPLIT